MTTRVYFGDTPATRDRVSEAFEWSGIGASLREADTVFVKPNLTFPVPRDGVTTSPAAIKTVLECLSDYGKTVYVGESDGGYGSFRIEDAFRGFGLREMCRRTGAHLVNLSEVERMDVQLAARDGEVTLALPRLLCDGAMHTMTLPVPKVHCMTGVSLSLKNQWGCLPDPMRLRQHVYFNDIIDQICRVVNVKSSVIDGTYGLDVNGPIVEGKAVPLGWFLASANPFAADCVAAYLIGQDLTKIEHYRRSIELGLVPHLEQTEINVPSELLAARATVFTLRRNFWNHVAKTAWYSRRWNHLVYESALSGPLHDIMYTFRKRPAEFDARR